MPDRVESALARTVEERTCRFWSVTWPGDRSGLVSRLMQGATEGIVDFVTGRAITRSVDISDGGTGPRLPGGERRATPPIYMFFDGTSVSGCLLGEWRNPGPSGAAGSYRGPAELRFLDLMRPESIV